MTICGLIGVWIFIDLLWCCWNFWFLAGIGCLLVSVGIWCSLEKDQNLGFSLIPSGCISHIFRSHSWLCIL
jgi:hypothetical protein